nr:aspartate kinase [Bacteroidota bacterium]
MKVFKFGGASVKDADGVRNVANVLRHFPGEEILVVVSAMGKTTNALEKIVWNWRDGKDTKGLIEELRHAHMQILLSVVPGFEEVEAWLY